MSSRQFDFIGSFIRNSNSIRCNDQVIDLRYFVHWHYPLWIPAVKAVIGDPKRFYKKRVLEIGCGDGRMSCLFGLLGATVLGVDVKERSLVSASEEAKKWNLQHHVTFENYDGDPLGILGQPYDYVFTKSVLVIIPNLEQYLISLKEKMCSGGELLLVENLSQGIVLRRVRRRMLRLIRKHTWGIDPYSNFRGVDNSFFSSLHKSFNILEFRKYYGLVAAIRARRML